MRVRSERPLDKRLEASEGYGRLNGIAVAFHPEASVVFCFDDRGEGDTEHIRRPGEAGLLGRETTKGKPDAATAFDAAIGIGVPRFHAYG
jgi:hypothetical protein